MRGVITLSAIMAASTAAAVALLGFHVALPSLPGGDKAAVRVPPIVPPPLLLRPLEPRNALKINRTIPFSREPNTAASPFKLRGNDASFDRAVECLATAIYYEAGAEPLNGRRAVAQIVLNRVRHPAFVPSVCGVVYEGSTRITGCQFSFTCDGSMWRRPSILGWAEARAIAARALRGAVFEPVGNGTHYHTDYVVPYWATGLAKIAVVGRHIFYRWPNWWGTAAAFSRRHSGEEPDPGLLRAIALRGPGNNRPAASDLAAQSVLETDPRVELMNIIQFLAAGLPRGEPPSAYEDDVRKHFSRFSEHLAVQIYRQLSSGDSRSASAAFLKMMMQHSEPPQLTPRGATSGETIRAIGGTQKLFGFMSSIRDFAKQSDFVTFFRERHAFYPQLAAQGRGPPLPGIEKPNGPPSMNHAPPEDPPAEHDPPTNLKN